MAALYVGLRMTSTMHTHMEVAGQTPASRAPRAHATWQGADLLAPSEFESFLDDYLMSTVEGGGAVPGEHGGTKQLRQRQQEQRRQGPAAQLRSNPLTSRWATHRAAKSLLSEQRVHPARASRPAGHLPTHSITLPTRCGGQMHRLTRTVFVSQVCSRRQCWFAVAATVSRRRRRWLSRPVW